MTASVNRDVTERMPLQASATSSGPVASWRILPRSINGTPTHRSTSADTCDTSNCSGKVIWLKRMAGMGIISSRQAQGNNTARHGIELQLEYPKGAGEECGSSSGLRWYGGETAAGGNRYQRGGAGSGFIPGTNAQGFTFQQASRPYFSQYPNFGVINQISSSGTSNYNSLQVTLRTRVWHGVSTQFNYTWAHSLDEITAYVGAIPQDSTNFKNDYGNSDFDIRHNFGGYVVYDIPGAHWGPEWLTHGWEVTSKMQFHTGLPFTVFASYDTSGTGENTTRGVQVGNPYAGVNHTQVQGQPVQWINPSRVRESGAGQLRDRWAATPWLDRATATSILRFSRTYRLRRGFTPSFASSCSTFSIASIWRRPAATLAAGLDSLPTRSATTTVLPASAQASHSTRKSR